MNKELTFIIYCIELYRKEKGMNGNAVIELFDKYSVCNYIKKIYESLHSTGSNYIINDIDCYIKSKENLIQN